MHERSGIYPETSIDLSFVCTGVGNPSSLSRLSTQKLFLMETETEWEIP